VCRKSLPVIIMTVDRLVKTLEAVGPEQAVDIDAALMCQMFDALGLVGGIALASMAVRLLT